jgi:hypothetical protein
MALRLDAIDFEAGQANLDGNDRKTSGRWLKNPYAGFSLV